MQKTHNIKSRDSRYTSPHLIRTFAATLGLILLVGTIAKAADSVDLDLSDLADEIGNGQVITGTMTIDKSKPNSDSSNTIDTNSNILSEEACAFRDVMNEQNVRSIEFDFLGPDYPAISKFPVENIAEIKKYRTSTSGSEKPETETIKLIKTLSAPSLKILAPNICGENIQALGGRKSLELIPHQKVAIRIALDCGDQTTKYIEMSCSAMK